LRKQKSFSGSFQEERGWGNHYYDTTAPNVVYSTKQLTTRVNRKVFMTGRTTHTGGYRWPRWCVALVLVGMIVGAVAQATPPRCCLSDAADAAAQESACCCANSKHMGDSVLRVQCGYGGERTTECRIAHVVHAFVEANTQRTTTVDAPVVTFTPTVRPAAQSVCRISTLPCDHASVRASAVHTHLLIGVFIC